MKIAFIGFGSMAGAMAKGLLRAGACAPLDIYACAAHYDALAERAGALGINAAATPAGAASAADMVILAVKPYQIEAVVAPMRDMLCDKPIVCIAAGWGFERLDALIPGMRHISTIPNTPVEVCEGIMVCEEKHSLTADEYAAFCTLFGHIALVETVDSAHLSIGGTLAGCTPAYAAMFIEALADAGVKHGLSRAASYRIAAKMLCGTGRLSLETGVHPGAMKDAVCSPGGTTIKGVAALERTGFRGSVMAAIDAAEE